MARKQQHFIEDIVDTTARLPWWLGVLLAVAAYFFMRWLALPDTPPPGTVHPPGTVVTSSVVRGLALAGQFLLPLIFLTGALISAVQDIKSRRTCGTRSREPERGQDTPAPTPPTHPRTPEPDLYPVWRAAGQEQHAPGPINTNRWSLELLHALEWKRFEHLCAAYFEELGFRAKTVRAGPDGGVDIHLFPEGAQHPGIIVQCKAWKTKRIGVNLIRELFGVMTADKVAEGIFATTGTFSSDATLFADGKNIHLIDGEGLLTKLQAMTPEQQQRLLTFATEGDFRTPTCPSCGIKMLFRTPRTGGNPFWGCPNYPRCTTILQAAKR